MAWVQQLPSGSFRIGWKNPDGSPGREVVPAANKTEAKRMAHQREQQAWLARAGVIPDRPEEPTIAEAIRLRIDALPPEFATKKNLKEKLRYVEDAFGKRRPSSITAADVLTMLAKLPHLSPQMREHIRMSGQGLITFLTNKARVYSGPNPFKEAGPVKVPKRQVRTYPTDFLPRLFDTLQPHHRTPVATALLTGVRKGEVRVMLKANVHLNERYILLTSGGRRDTTKGGRERRVPIPEILVPALTEQLATPGPYLFPRPGTSKPYGPNWRVHDVMARACVRAGLIKGWRPYCFRKACGWKGQLEHEATERECPECKRGLRWKEVAQDLRFKHLRSTWGTVAYTVTRDLRLVADVLGHADIETTRMHYAATIPEHVQAGAEATAAALSPWRPRGVTTEETGGQQRKPTPTQEVRIVNEVKVLARQGKAEEAREPVVYGFLNRRPQVRFLSGSLPKLLLLLGFRLRKD
ncbi:phage integrase family protein [Corallococcus macrosporus]|uniref:Phage integrase family protein n=1 Tax=Myxococcus fulvus (strain ATCC BAA-855 / HW-1) TaxID=483219 RepID=F8C7Y1_MYXFH|nr:phage integrase family protein [Corallococcus macrosporus]